MSFEQFKVTSSEISQTRMEGRADPLPSNLTEAQKAFDDFPLKIVEKHNALLDSGQLVDGANPEFENMPMIDGVPLVERGENENGEWEKWWDGTLICRRKLISSGSSSPLGSLDFSSSSTFVFPVPFIETPYVKPICFFTELSQASWGTLRIPPTKLQCNIQLATYQAFTNFEMVRGYEAVGRWK